ncbi:cupin domain-containing protein [Glacieibacterium frigidum]|uniref:Cupin domain-containing protein n=1 Tax=Glacieibacterium frigidum TaxID=2593303 RepID=A0A552UFI8_9SPHN|nr:cupin domain-containing protein [Glacieibacterium frigidum]TRW16983.1 cupin domain-containing protein [Glacieibacterium frigidum]
MPKLALDAIPSIARTGYPPPHDAAVQGRSWVPLAGALTDVGVNLVTLAPGAASSQRHWHSAEDELVYMLAGEAVLIEDDGETLLHPGDVAVFPKGVPNAHHLVNRSAADVRFLAIGPDKPGQDACVYPDIGMRWSNAEGYTLGH